MEKTTALSAFLKRNLMDEHFMRLALEEAEAAFKESEIPVGAIIVKENRVIATAHNTKEAETDPTAHAELIVLREGASEIGNWRLTDTTLYVTKEPCIMCAGAMINARLGKLIYGCRDTKAGGVDSLYNILSDKRLNHQLEVVSRIFEDECAEILKKFFEMRR